jgi:hypothetical protein
MSIRLDTNVLVQLSGTKQILDAVLGGRLELAVSNEVRLEYEEVITALSGRRRWHQIDEFLHQLSAVRQDGLYVEPHYRFSVITP